MPKVFMEHASNYHNSFEPNKSPSGSNEEKWIVLEAFAEVATESLSCLQPEESTNGGADKEQLFVRCIETESVEKSSTSTAPDTVIQLADANVLDLPKDLMMRILSQMSVKDVAYAQCVCKVWRDYIRLPIFLGPCGETPWYYWYNGGGDICKGCVFDPDKNRWRTFSLPHMASRKQCIKYVASSMSFVLFGKESKKGIFWICNVWKRTGIKLPPPPTMEKQRWDNFAISLTVKEGKHFIIMAKFQGSDISLDMYTSETKKWSSLLSFSQKGWVGTRVSSICNGNFYFLMCQDHSQSKFLIMCCSLFSIKIHRLDVEMDLTWIQLVNCNDQLVLVGATRAKYPSNPSVSVWVLSDSQWQKLSDLPMYMYTREMTHEFMCSGSNNVFYLHSPDQPAVIMYNIESKSWFRSSRCSYIQKSEPHFLFRGFALQPSWNG